MDEPQIQRIWAAFDQAAKIATTPDGRAVIMALRALAELTNDRIADLELAAHLD